MSGVEQPAIPPIEGRRITKRHRRLWRLHDFSRGRGLEIGPLHNRLLYKEQADVHYLDVFDQARLRQNYASHQNVKKENIPEIDYVLFDGRRVRDISAAVGDDPRFDWVVAAHVLEHVPDVIGWLDQVAQVTVDDGRLVLLVPDRRYCFDIHRPGTTVGQLLLEHELGMTAPSVRAVYDSKRSHAATAARDAWSGLPPGYSRRVNTLAQVVADLDRVRAGEYVDVHAWAFTSGSLVEQLVELRRLGLSQWLVESMTPTPWGEVEFYTVLRRLPRGQDWTQHEFDEEVRPPRDMPDWLAQTSRWQRRNREARRRLDRKQARIDKLQAEVRTLRAERHHPGRSLLGRVRRRLSG